MYLNSLKIHNFRNIPKLEEDFDPGFNIIVGGNAQGKTNLLEAIFILTSVRSFRGSRTVELLTKDSGEQTTASCVIQGRLKVGSVDKELKMSIDAQGKKISLNGKEVKKAEDIMSQFKAVVFTPDDLGIIKGGPEARRRYIDMVAFNIRPGHWRILKRYHTVLQHRNKLLKMGIHDRSQLEPWENQLADYGAQVIQGRILAIKELNPIVEAVFVRLAGSGSPKIDFFYNSTLLTQNSEDFEDAEKIKEFFKELLARRRKEELRRGTTLTGPHRDDLQLILGDKDMRDYGSQGQQRMLTLALKFGEVEAISNFWGEQPILLLDDISSELDFEKNSRLLSLVFESKPQVFLTTTDPNLTLPGQLGPHAKFEMEEGVLERIH